MILWISIGAWSILFVVLMAVLYTEKDKHK